MINFFNKRKSLRAAGMLFSVGLIVMVEIIAFVLFPTVVHAQIPVTETSSLEEQVTRALEVIGEVLYTAALGAVIQGVSHFTRKIAYDTATYIASGGKGQGALVFEDGIGAYMEKVGGEAVGEAIHQLGEGFLMDLCQPPDLDFQIGLKVGLSELYDPSKLQVDPHGAGPQPNCNWQDIKSSWESGAANDFGIGGAEQFASGLDVGQTDFGVALGAIGRIDNLQIQQRETAKVEQLLGDGFKPVTELISGDVKTPAAVIEEETKAVTGGKQVELTNQQIAGIYGAGADQILPMAASVFINTLTSQLLNQLFTEGLVPSKKEQGSAANLFATRISSNRAAARRAFSFFKAAPIPEQGSIDIITEFSACDDTSEHGNGIYNCVMDEKLKGALIQNSDKLFTIQEAMEGGFLNPDMPLISPKDEPKNSSVKCFQTGYCYSNIQKMRKARILPLGFEIAALMSNPDQPWKLGDVVEGFEDCERDLNGLAIYSPQKPFCHLINPNWVLKAPKAQCEAYVWGPKLLIPNADDRRRTCADISTCVEQNADGTCRHNYYSYCTQEKNEWSFGDAEACEPQNATCRQFIDSGGEVLGMLTRTVDIGGCRADSIGCEAYSREKNADDEWESSEVGVSIDEKRLGRHNTLYFDDGLEERGYDSCDGKDEGCHAYFLADAPNGLGQYVTTTASILYLKKAPDYLGCYDTEPGGAIQWPAVEADLGKLPDTEQCAGNDFAHACVPSEVGCNAYVPADGRSTVELPAVIGEENRCSESCVGYDAFQQEETDFEPVRYPLNFRLQDGQSCAPAHAGCDEFTNIDEGPQGESKKYFKQIKYCELPEEDDAGEIENQETFYSWEGSVSEGYILRVHKLRPVLAQDNLYLDTINPDLKSDTVDGVFPVGSPAYADDRKEKIEDNYKTCNAQTYQDLLSVEGLFAEDPDCRALYDKNQNIFYRKMSQLVTVSNACTTWRKTESHIYHEDELDNTAIVFGGESLCEVKGGVFDNGQCMRCYNGGVYVGGQNPEDQGACVYKAMTGTNESLSCPATANGCRAYTGSGAGNLVELFGVGGDTFIPASSSPQALAKAKQGWVGTSLKVVSEAVVLGDYSLSVNQDTAVVRDVPLSLVESGDWFELRFWARGAPQNLSIRLSQAGESWEFTNDPITGSQEFITLTDSWQQYELGPIQFTGVTNTPMGLAFDHEGGSGTQYFLDNVELSILHDHEHLIKNSWKQLVDVVDPATGESTVVLADVAEQCDSNPFDAFPGEEFGCREYNTDTDPARTVDYATGFRSLCREEAVGCTAVFDTHNTVSGVGSTRAQVFNAECINAAGAATSITTCEVTKGGLDIDKSCSIDIGQDRCFVDKIILEDGEVDLLGYAADIGSVGIGPSTIIIPADEDTAYFLTNTPDSRCDERNLGCELVAREDHILPDSQSSSYDFSETHLINRPDDYVGDQGYLCNRELLSCEEFRSDNQTYYFKDPRKTGSKLCEYVEELPGDASGKGGWFMKDVGRCGAVEGDAQNPALPLCRSSEDCSDGETCVGTGTVACYPNYFEDAASYGIWSNGAPDYEGFVGVCPIDEHLCTEIVDPANTTASSAGEPYYYIYDDRLTGQTGECGGQAGLREGCVLFDKTDQPSKLYDTTETYLLSEQKATAPGIKAKAGFSLVTPVSNDQNNANILLKVDRDRQCSEWLTCTDWETVVDENGKKTDVCSNFDKCSKLNPGGGCGAGGDVASDGTILDLQEFINRGTGWADSDYSGYSIFNQRSMADVMRLILNKKDFASYLVHDQGKFAACALDNIDQEADAKNGVECGDGGRCWSGRCISPVDGRFANGPAQLSEEEMREGLLGASCKAPPERDAPFFSDLIVDKGVDDPVTPKEFGEYPSRNEFTLNNETYGGANVCQNTDGSDCSCAYQRVQYNQSITDFWQYFDEVDEEIPRGVCGSGELEGQPCESNSDCRTLVGEAEEDGFTQDIYSPGTCNLIEKKQSIIGQLGFCLEYDLSRPLGTNLGGEVQYACLTWLPIDKNASVLDTNNYFPRAGFYPAEDTLEETFQDKYCVAATAPDMYRESQFDTKDGITDIIGSADGQEDLYFFKDSDLYNHAKQLDNNAAAAQNNRYKCYLDAILDVDGGSVCTSKNLYTSVQGWAWKVFGLDAVVLRSERTTTRNIKFGGYYCDYDGSSGDDPMDCEKDREEHKKDWENFMVPFNEGGSINKMTMYNLLPRPHHYNFTKPTSALDTGDNKKVPEVNYIRSLGTLYYPPRIWDEPDPLTPTTDLEFNFESTERPKLVANGDTGYAGFTELGYRMMSGLHMSPGPRYQTDDGMEAALYRSEYEAVLNESDLDIVHFVPTAFPGGKSRFNPLLLAQDIFIDFTYLQTKSVAGADPVALFPAQAYQNSEKRDGVALKTQSGCRTYKDKDEGATNGEKGFVNGCGDVSGETFVPQLDTENGALVLSYMVERDQGKDDLLDLKYADYELVGFDDPNTDPDPRNEIHRRYVMIFFENKPENVPWLETKTTAAGKIQFEEKIPDFDVFFQNKNTTLDETLCYKERNTNWFAIGMDFNENGEFLGYLSRWCNDYEASMVEAGGTGALNDYSRDVIENGINMAVIANVNSSCTEFHEVHNNKERNKAWTNRLWIESQAIETDEYLGFRRLWEIFPFGAIGLQGTSVKHVQSTDDAFSLRSYPFVSHDEDGVPFACFHDLLGTNGNAYGFYCKALLATELSSVDGIGYDQPLTFELGQNANSLENARGDLAKLFIKSLHIQSRAPLWFNSFDPATWYDHSVIDRSGSKNGDGEYLYQGAAPRIFSVNPAKCLFTEAAAGQGGGDRCMPGEMDNFTIDGFNGTLNDYDLDENGEPDEDSLPPDSKPDSIIRFGGSFEATTRFFAAADDNHLPIAGIMIDWDDGGPVYGEGSPVLARNNKPYCRDGAIGHCGVPCDADAENCVPSTTLTCDEDADCPYDAVGANGVSSQRLRCILPNNDDPTAEVRDYETPSIHDRFGVPRFGDSERACVEGPRTVTHVYSCDSIGASEEYLASDPNGDAALLGLIPDSVISEAEKGYMNALGVNDDDWVCVYKPKVQIMDNWEWCNGNDGAGGYQGIYEDSFGLCTGLHPTSWTPYQGQIILVASEE